MKLIHDILLDEQTIAGKVEELAIQISKDYANKELLLVCILKGAFTFTADLMRLLTVPTTVEFIQASSYGTSTTSSRNVVIKQGVSTDLRGQHVLLVDTVIDSGKTLASVMQKFSRCGPTSLATVALLDKKSRRAEDIQITYRGFEIPDIFVVGYGLDIGEQYRNLPYIAALNPAD
jgi:hypoxanthine phosphoribosyltransferase